jgi:predicted transporter
MEEHQKIEEAVDNIREHINTRYELVVLKASERISGVAASFISGFLIVFVSVLSLVLLSFAAAFYLGHLLKDDYIGFMIVGGMYFLLGAILLFFRKKLLDVPLRDKMIREFYKEN